MNRLYKFSSPGAKWKYPKEECHVLKGDRVRTKSAEQVMEEARRAASDYIRRSTVRGRRRGPGLWGLVLAGAGAAAVGIACLALYLAHML